MRQAPASGPATAPNADASSLLTRQREAFLRDGPPGLATRRASLARLRDALHAHEAALIEAVNADFGSRSPDETRLLELFPLYDQIRYARAHLRRWMRRRHVGSSWFLQPSRAYYQYQPLGVVGVIGAWNYPLLLTLGPVIDAIAAGNRVILKPSEIAPRTAEALARLVHECFEPEWLACVTGGPDVAAAFTALPFDHLFFTGSTRVGKLVMRAAAENLTPVTLELGGKSPAILHESYPLARALERVLTGKLLNAGQTCVAPDYVLLPEGREAEFEREARRAVAALYPRLRGNPDYTCIVSPAHHARLHALVESARAAGARVAPLSDEGAASEDRVFVPTLVFEAPAESALMREEIFGPVLPVVTYRTLDEAIAYVNARPHPLALYYFDHDARRVDRVLERTRSGGVLVNDCMFHLGQHALPFGGVGASGMGHYHGFDGFVTFSKKRAIMVQPRWTPLALFRPPYTPPVRRLAALLLRIARGR
jgi:coniferyl-aldehyde dehydrogenase